ncbi:MAG: rubredoxin-like domain-containing protein, partial [Candidatus Sigynarchaeota archaeon]
RIVVSRHALEGYKPVMPPLEDLPTLWSSKEPDVAAVEGLDTTQTVWRCRICGAIFYGNEPPDECPYCRFPKTAFKKVWPKA